MSRSLPDLLIEKLALEELPASTRDQIVHQLKQDPEARARLDEITASNADVLKRYPPNDVLPAIRRRHQNARAARSRRQTRWITAPALAASAIAIAVAIVFVGTPHDPLQRDDMASSSSGTRIKGETMLLVYRQAADGKVELLSDRDTVHTGDRLQLAYRAGNARFGVIASIDGRQVVTLHYPMSARTSTALDPRGERRLSSSYVLDDAPRFETFFLVTSDRPLRPQTVLAALEKHHGQPRARRELPASWHLQMITLIKAPAEREQ